MQWEKGGRFKRCFVTLAGATKVAANSPNKVRTTISSNIVFRRNERVRMWLGIYFVKVIMIFVFDLERKFEGSGRLSITRIRVSDLQMHRLGWLGRIYPCSEGLRATSAFSCPRRIFFGIFVV